MSCLRATRACPRRAQARRRRRPTISPCQSGSRKDQVDLLYYHKDVRQTISFPASGNSFIRSFLCYTSQAFPRDTTACGEAISMLQLSTRQNSRRPLSPQYSISFSLWVADSAIWSIPRSEHRSPTTFIRDRGSHILSIFSIRHQSHWSRC